MKKMGLADSALCACGKEQAAKCFLEECTTSGPPCGITDLDNPK